MNAKIRDFGLAKVPFILILGDKEENTQSVSVRTRGKGDGGSIPLTDFLTRATTLLTDRAPNLT